MEFRVEDGRLGAVEALPGGGLLLDAGQSVRFHSGEISAALSGVEGLHVSFLGNDIF